jgi:hypothetical protein
VSLTGLVSPIAVVSRWWARVSSSLGQIGQHRAEQLGDGAVRQRDGIDQERAGGRPAGP